MKVWITKFLIYALIPLFFFTHGYANEPGSDTLSRASQDIDTSSAVIPVAREEASKKLAFRGVLHGGLLKRV
jgi:hypothetical protein